VLRYPAHQTFGGANFYLILKALQDIEPLAEGDGPDGFANLRGRAPDDGLLIPGVGGFERCGRVVKTNIEADHKNEREGATQQDFSSQRRAP